MRSGNIGTALRRLAVPAVIGMLVNAVYNVVDTAFIGLLHDTPSIGASAILFPVFMLIGAIGLTFGMGAASVVSRRLGEQNTQAARETASTAFYTTLFIGLLFVLLGNLFLSQILILFGATETIMDRSMVYGRIIISGSLFQILNMCMNNLLRSEGASRYSSIALMTGGILNILLDPLFMFVFRMGLAGAALATVTAQMVSTIYLLTFFVARRGILRIRLRDFTPRLKVYGSIMAIGLPTFARQVLSSVAIGMFNHAAAVFGDAAVAAMGIILRILSLVMMVLFGIGQGLQPLAGFNFGARQYDRVITSTGKAILWSSVFAGFMSVIFVLFARPAIGLFSADPEVLRIGVPAFRLMASTLVFVGSQVCFSTLYQAIGKGAQAGVLALARQGIFFIPLILTLPRLFQLPGVLVSQPLADFLAFVLTLFMGLAELRVLKGMEKV